MFLLLACTAPESASSCQEGSEFYGTAVLEGEEEAADFFRFYSRVRGSLELRDLRESSVLTGLCSVEGTLRIGDGELVELWGMESMGPVQSLQIEDLPLLEGLSGLVGISGTEVLQIEDVPALSSMVGLPEDLPLKSLSLELEENCGLSGLSLSGWLDHLSYQCAGVGEDLGALSGLSGGGEFYVAGAFGPLELEWVEVENIYLNLNSPSLQLPKLSRVDQLTLRLEQVEEVELPALTSARTLYVSGGELVRVDLGQLAAAQSISVGSEQLEEVTGMGGVSFLSSGLSLSGPLTRQQAFPGLESLATLRVEGAQWVSLPAFPSLKEIQYSLQLSEMPALRDLAGLGSATVAGFRFSNIGLQDLSDLDGRLLEGGRLELLENQDLREATVLGTLSEVGVVHIRDNPSLSALEFSSLQVADRLEIERNDQLCLLEFPQLRRVDTVRVTDNPCLSDAEILEKLEGVEVTGGLLVEGNGI